MMYDGPCQNCPSLGKTAYVYGWGTTSSGGASSSKLLEVGVPVVTSAQCATSMGPMEGGQICAGGEAGKDSCQVLTLLTLCPQMYVQTITISTI